MNDLRNRNDCWLCFIKFLRKNNYINLSQYLLLTSNIDENDIKSGISIERFLHLLVDNNFSIVRGRMCEEILIKYPSKIVGLVFYTSFTYHVIGFSYKNAKNIIIMDYEKKYEAENYINKIKKFGDLVYIIIK
jgi:hypothetical protein